LKLYTKVPPNGLVVYCGAVLTETGKERQMRIDFEPFKPINTSLYMCDNKFHTQALSDLLVNDDKYGFVVMDGNGTLFGTVCGNHREILQKITVDLPKKHGRGGQSALRFARLRLEKRQNYLTKVAELTTQHFISNDKPNVAGLVLAGSADFKNRLAEADCFDQRLQAVTLAVVDVSYGGENGFNQAIELSADTLSSLKFVQEKKLVGRFFDEIAQDTGKYVFGINDTLTCLEMGACETLVCWENLEVMRVILKNPQTEEEIIKHLRPEEMGDGNDHVRDKEGNDLEVVDSQPLLEWLANEYKKFGCILEIISDKSQEGNQFCRGFGGIGGLLRYQVDLSTFEVPEDADSDDWDSDDSECFI
jgi:peptide chain release factor subunit 1